MSTVDRLKLRRKTVIFFTTDNGTSKRFRARLGDRVVRGGKGLLTENGPWQPFIVNAPGIVPAGVVTDTLTDFTDMLPTFAELAGAPIPPGAQLDGHSLAGVLRGEQRDGTRKWILAMGRGPAALDSKGVRPQQVYTDRVLRDKRFKVHVQKGRITRLHDLKTDPTEEINLLESVQSAHVAARRKFSAVISDFPKKDPRPRYTPTPPQPWDRKPDTP